MRWLLDEMLPRSAAVRLTELGHDARTAHDADPHGAPDDEVFDVAVREKRTIVTENFADFARLVEYRLGLDQACVPVVFVRKSDFPKHGALATLLAARLDA